MDQVWIGPVTRADAAALIAANIASGAYHAPWVHPFTDIDGFDTWYGEIATGANVGLVARAGPTGPIVGVVNLSQIFRKGFQNAYLAYYGMAAFARRGLMTRAVGLAVRYAFDDIGLHRLEANIQPGNAASIALIKRVGFRKEGFSPRYLRIDDVWHDHERWAILADDPPNVEYERSDRC